MSNIDHSRFLRTVVVPQRPGVRVLDPAHEPPDEVNPQSARPPVFEGKGGVDLRRIPDVERLRVSVGQAQHQLVPVAVEVDWDADEVLKKIRASKLLADLIGKVSITAITIREKAVERAIQAKKEGWGPDRILFMVSTSESHHRKNSGLSLAEYWKMVEKYIPMAKDAGLKVNGTVSTIWGCPIEGPTKMEKAIEFTKRWLDIGVNDVEHADHDGSASPDRVYRYYSMLLDSGVRVEKQIVHFHTTRGWGLANVLAALQAGM